MKHLNELFNFYYLVHRPNGTNDLLVTDKKGRGILLVEEALFINYIAPLTSKEVTVYSDEFGVQNLHLSEVSPEMEELVFELPHYEAILHCLATSPARNAFETLNEIDSEIFEYCYEAKVSAYGFKTIEQGEVA